MRTRGFVALVALAIAGLLIAGCGGSGKEAAQPSTTTKPPVAPSTPQQLAADKAIAKKAVLRLSDVPAGFTATPHDNSPDEDTPPAVLRKFAACAHVPQDQLADFLSEADDPLTPSVDAPDFEKETSPLETVSFENSVALARSVKEISEPIEVLAAPAALPCWKDLFEAIFAELATEGNATVGPVTVTPLPTPSVGDQAAAFQAKMALTARGVTVPLFMDFYLARQGRAGISLLGLAAGREVDHALELELARTVADRLRSELDGTPA